jgi:PTS system mannose-specific IIA component
MIGLVLTTHGSLGEALILSMNVILGEQPQVEALSLQVEDDIEEANRRLREAVQKVDSGDGALILTDMLGGTPSNLSLALLSQPGIEVISGVNLPMLLKATQARQKHDLKGTSRTVKEHARSSIIMASEVLEEGKGEPAAP